MTRAFPWPGRRWFGVLLPAPLLALACCTIGPSYHRPVVAGPAAGWIDAAASPAPVASRWWAALNDPVLDALIDDATSRNLDIREASARLREARAERSAAVGRAGPQADAAASANEVEVSDNGEIPIGRIPGFSRRLSLFDAGFDASWEVDLWGAARRDIEAASARRERAAAQLADIRLQTIAETARTYADLRAAQARLASLRDDAALLTDLAKLVASRFAGGEAPRADTVNAAQRAASARAAVSGAAADARAAIYRLSLLTGRPPEALLATLTPAAELPAPPAIVAQGIRSQLLERRADVRAAEADLAAATADIGVQQANWFPRLSLVGALGQQSRSLGDLASGASTRFQVGPSFSWPIFSAGRITAEVHAADARADEAAARYEKAVLGALSDSETAINRYAATRASLAEREAALRGAQAASGLAAERFQAGEDDRMALLQARSAERAIEQQAIAARADAIRDYVALAKALGGGWEASTPVGSQPDRASPPAAAATGRD